MTTDIPEAHVVPGSADGETELVRNLRAALDTRDVIGQAKGVLMERTGCSADEAFAELVRRSQADNRKLVSIAEDVAQGARRPPNGHA